MKPNLDVINEVVEILIPNEKQRIVLKDDTYYYTDKAQELFDMLYDYIEEYKF
tara:strand:- start:559 stop:717 length:159 start_codon:yes stop_codon:yes gene_type:complete